MNKMFVSLCLTLCTLTQLPTLAMKREHAKMHMWSEQSQPTLHLITTQEHAITGLMVTGDHELFSPYFEIEFQKGAQHTLTSFLCDNNEADALLCAALARAVSRKEEVYVRFDHMYKKSSKRALFIASILFIQPNTLHIKVTEDTTK